VSLSLCLSLSLLVQLKICPFCSYFQRTCCLSHWSLFFRLHFIYFFSDLISFLPLILGMVCYCFFKAYKYIIKLFIFKPSIFMYAFIAINFHLSAAFAGSCIFDMIPCVSIFIFSRDFFFLSVLGIELRAFHWLSKSCSLYYEPNPQSFCF
jgi:hypothetical protein